MENTVSIESIVSALRTMRPDLEISTNETIKNKQKLQGITIKSPSARIAPNIYVENYISHFHDVDSIADAILNTYEEHKCFDGFNVSDILNKDFILSNVTVIMQQESDENLIKLPNISSRYPGSEAYLAVVSQADAENTFSIKLTPQILQSANLSIEDDHLFEHALSNLKEQVVIASMFETLKQMTGLPDDCEMPLPFDDSMFVITNKSKTKGAASILCDDILKDFAKEHHVDSFWLIPSSVHECLIVLDNQNFNIDCLSQMVTSVNQTEVDKEDWLSSEAWLYTVS